MNDKLNHENITFLEDGGQMGELMRLYPWSDTALGAPEKWPQSLKSTLSLVLNSHYPMLLYWGPNYYCFYNDAFRISLGSKGKHPRILGMKGEEAWSEMWSTLGPLLDGVITDGKPTWRENMFLPINRNGTLEDAYWTFGYSAIKNEANVISGVLTICTETTASVEAVKKLEKSEDDLKFAIDATDLGTWDYDPLNDKLKTNDRIKGWFGLDAKEEIELYQATNAIIEEDRERVNATILNVFDFNSGGKYDITYTIRNKQNGQERYVRALGRAWFNEDKIAYRFNGTLQDITDQQKSLEKLRVNESRFRRLVKEIPVGICILSVDNYVINVVNDMALLIWQKTLEESHNQPLFSVLTEIKEGIIPIFEVLIATKKAQYGNEYPFVLERNGIKETGYFNFIFEPVLNQGEVSEIMLVAFEVTAAVKARFELEESERQFKNFVMQSPVSMGILRGYELKIEMANDSLLKTFWRKKMHEVEGKGLLELFPNLKDSKYPQVMHHILDTGIPVSEKESYVTFEEKGSRWEFYVDYDYVPLRDLDGTVSGIMFTTTDVTDRVEARQKTELFSKNLENQVIQRTNQLKEANDKLQLSIRSLENRNKELEAFAYVSSHDLQEPLRKIQMFADRVASRDLENLSDKGVQDFNKIISSAERMRTLIEDLLAFSRTSNHEAKFEKVDLQVLLKDVIDTLSDKIKATKTSLEYDALVTASVIPFQIRQIFQNILENAMKFAKEGVSPIIKIKTLQVSGEHLEHLNLLPENTYTEITFMDNGIGFAPQYGEQIFELFQRLHGKLEYKGTGIGLAIVKKIAENHHGTIIGIGKEGVGAEFKLYLPLSS
ncbi:PAS domain S-box protein [Cellulophaga sp. E16_2]|uniref:PAS domain-containing sensor histidine kinase n=1 Tax=Cellulophaga sp. E16_2 TaxID=2789297 RepID=UPI001A93950F|nr:PAS domain-containing sensor histidine kinase [Cellulophaga sp. E16_2]MBO0593220.1 PAS domain S-box protein [Cellulophaga sp. E16_2]